MVPEKALELKAMAVGGEKREEVGLRMEEDPPLTKQSEEALNCD